METISQFIQQFVRQDFICNKARFDFNSSELEYGQFVEQARTFFHHAVPNPYNKWGIKARNLNDPEWLEQYDKDFKRTRQRAVFQIRHYRSPLVGDILREKMRMDELWGCLCSYQIDNGQASQISRMYFVAETDEGLKIIYDWGFEDDQKGWRQTHDHLPSRVEHAGTLVEVLNLQPPVELASLGEYFNPTHSAYTMIN